MCGQEKLKAYIEADSPKDAKQKLKTRYLCS